MDKHEIFDDGITHINVYSKSRCLLGRLLSNFAHTPFEIDGLSFMSVESWWYYFKMLNINNSMLFPIFDEEQITQVRNSIGKEAKNKFRELYKDDSKDFNPSPEEVRSVYLIKANSNLDVYSLLVNSKLPFTHYYVMFNKKISADKYLWTAELWEEIKQELIKKDI